MLTNELIRARSEERLQENKKYRSQLLEKKSERGAKNEH